MNILIMTFYEKKKKKTADKQKLLSSIKVLKYFLKVINFHGSFF